MPVRRRRRVGLLGSLLLPLLLFLSRRGSEAFLAPGTRPAVSSAAAGEEHRRRTTAVFPLTERASRSAAATEPGGATTSRRSGAAEIAGNEPARRRRRTPTAGRKDASSAAAAAAAAATTRKSRRDRSLDNHSGSSDGRRAGTIRLVRKKKEGGGRRRSPDGGAGSEFWLETSMVDHDILTREEEQRLARSVQRANALQKRVDVLVEQQQESIAEELAHRRSSLDEDDSDDDDEEEELTSLSVYGGMDHSVPPDLSPWDSSWRSAHGSSSDAGRLAQFDATSRMTRAVLSQSDGGENDVGDGDWLLGRDDADLLTDEDVVRRLKLPGGREELRSILLEGARARDTLIRSNVRLVTGIAKRWARMSARRDAESLHSIYSGSWDRPSVNEAVQEGIIGLSRAVARFNPSRGLRLSTYATYWITNSVRQCFQRASTGCLRVPTNYYDFKSRYKSLVRHYYETEGRAPSFEVLAEQLDLTPERLRMILRMTQPLASVDAPVMSGGTTKAGKASIVIGDGDVLLSDTLVDDTELDAEDRVELSLLRQSLENALATELSPHERDVLRLRLGLDDGVSRTCRQVASECGGSLTISQVRSAEERAFKKLRSPRSLATYKLLTYVDFAGVDRKTTKLR